jgi:mRNA-degrading endonuclease RelE of RelBE toxin-antitoxin system
MNIDVSKIDKVLQKLKQKDAGLFRAVQKKIIQIAEMDAVAIEHFKNLRHDLSYLKRVQIGSFVLVFTVRGDTVVFEDLDHHDFIYDKQ